MKDARRKLHRVLFVFTGLGVPVADDAPVVDGHGRHPPRLQAVAAVAVVAS